MPTVYTHAVVGLGLGKLFTGRRIPWSFWGLAAFLPVLPDCDVFLNRTYGTMLGHRGFSHTLLFAAVIGLAVAACTFKYFKAPFWDLAGFFFAVTASHGILDAFTNGGYGIPLFWPFSSVRFGPWGPIQVADIGFEWPNPITSRSLRHELMYVWLPLAVVVGGVAFWRRR
jgi:inner membrane protein